MIIIIDDYDESSERERERETSLMTYNLALV